MKNVDKLAKICELLASDQPGEVLSAARVASNLLKNSGLTWTDVVNGEKAPKSENVGAPAANQASGKKINWRTAPGRLGRALIYELMLKNKLSLRGLAEKFFYLWPGCQDYFDQPLTPNVLFNRWDKGTRRGYENEHPDKNPETRKYLPYAKDIVAADVPITDADVQRIVAEVAKHDAVAPTDRQATSHEAQSSASA